MALDKILVVTKKTALEGLLLEHATLSQARFYVESRGKEFDEEYLNPHHNYKSVVEETIKNLPVEYRKQVIDKSIISMHQFDEHDIIVAIGDPGLFVNVAKYAGAQPIISINGEPKRFDDVFTTCGPEQIRKKVYKTSEGNVSIEELTMAEAVLDDGQRMLGLNDLFIGKMTHASARYALTHHNITEAQSSSGVVISTGTGSTAWMRAILAGAYGIANNRKSPGHITETFNKDSDYLRYFVREPFPTKVTGCSLVSGHVSKDNPLSIVSHMTEEGVIFSDGIEKDYISFNAGSSVIIRPAETKVQLVR